MIHDKNFGEKFSLVQNRTKQSVWIRTKYIPNYKQNCPNFNIIDYEW